MRNVLTETEQRLVNRALGIWQEMCAVHAELKDAGFQVRDIVGLQNPNCYHIEVTTRAEKKTVRYPYDGD